MKINVEFFQIQKSMLQTIRVEKVVCLVFMMPYEVIVLKSSKKVNILQFCADLSKKCIKEIYISASKRSRFALSENSIDYYAMTYCFGDIRVRIRRILLNFCWVSNFFDVLIANISWTVAQTPINHTIFWNSVMRTFRWMYVNCFNRFKLLALSQHNLL